MTLTREDVTAAFERIDKNGDGKLELREVVIACRKDPSIAALLGLSTQIRQEGSSRDALMEFFRLVDKDDSRSLDKDEFVNYFFPSDAAAGGEGGAKLELDYVNEPSAAEVQAGLGDLGKTADGLRQCYLTLALEGRDYTAVPEVLAFTHLQTLKLQGNALSTLRPLGALSHLTSLDVSHNRLCDLLLLDPPATFLREARLNSNNIAAAPAGGLGAYAKCLTALDLSDNKLTSTAGLEALAALRKLNLNRNAVSDNAQSLAKLEHLRLLALAGNALDSLEHVARIKTLSLLNVASNRLPSLDGIHTLLDLSELDATNNPIGDVATLAEAADLPLLHRLKIIQGCPAFDGRAEPRLDVLKHLNNITVLDGTDVDAKERVWATMDKTTTHKPPQYTPVCPV
mmetsp:Transcript_1892/g.6918  ORF Transcript_1892/g.6918 Transcript_1892/m.6918 type:complete len:399 (-) Transcript_1892:1018-2214(-)